MPTDTTPRTPRGLGSEYKRTVTRLNPDTGEREVVRTFYQYARDVDEDHLPPGETRHRITGSGPTPAAARKRFQVRWDRYHSGDPAVRRKKRGKPMPTLNELFVEWDHMNRLGAVSDTMASKYEGYFRLHVLPYLGTKKLDTITDDDLLVLFHQTLLAKQRKDGSPLLSTAATRNIYMALSGCFRYGVRKGYLDRSPMSALNPPRKQTPRDDPEEMSAYARRLLVVLREENSPDYCRWLMQFIGLRRAERLGLTWSNIRGLDTDHASMVISQQLARYADGSGWYIKAKTKTKRDRIVWLPEPFLSALRELRQRRDEGESGPDWHPEEQFADLVFLRPDGGLITLNRDNDEWRALLKRLGFPHWRGHLNRHITATWLAEQQPPVPEGTVRSILGHESDAMGFYYARSTELQQAGPLRRYGETLLTGATTPMEEASSQRPEEPRPTPSRRTPTPRNRRGRKHGT
jgi:integrase